MFPTRFSLLVLLTAAVAAPLARAQPQDCHRFAPAAIVKGRKFFNAVSGEYIPIKGVNYYPRPNEGELTQTNSIDFFSEAHRHVWERDIANFVKLGINMVRIYAINPSLNHDAFMCALKAAGIYVIVGMAAECENCAITVDPAPACYPVELKTRGEYILHQFSKYENVLAFSAGNEIGLELWTEPQRNAPCLKKFIRDMRGYQESCGLRKIPVGLAVVDWDRWAKAMYYNCRTDPDDELENAAFYGFNSYLHCTGWDEDVKGFEELREDLEFYKLTVPTIITEFGCVDQSFPVIDGREAQRTWGQVDKIFSPEFREVMVGGAAFEYSTERLIAETIEPTSDWPFEDYGIRNFGLGYLSPKRCDDINTNCTYIEVPQFDLLKQAYERVDTSTEPTMDEYDWDESTPTPECPANFPKLSDFTWPTDEVQSFQCPPQFAVFCAGVPEGCATFAPAQLITPAPTPRPTEPTSSPTKAPTKTETEAEAPTSLPQAEPTPAPVTPVAEITAAPVTPKDEVTVAPVSQGGEATDSPVSTSRPTKQPTTGISVVPITGNDSSSPKLKGWLAILLSIIGSTAAILCS